MARKKESKIIWIIVLLLFIFYFKPDFFGALITPTKEAMTNFMGDLSKYQGAMPSIVSDKINLGEYRIEISKKDYGEILGEPTCLPNTCNGNLLRIDEKNCDVWGYKECKSWYPNCDSFLVALSCHHWWCPACDCRGFGTPREYTGTDCNRFFNKDFDIMDGCIESQTGYSFTDAWSNIQTYIVPTTECGGYGRLTIHSNIPPEGTSPICEFTRNCECWYKADVYKNNELINSLDWDSNQFTGQRKIEIENEFSINFLSNYQINYIDDRNFGNDGCRWIQNNVNFLVPVNKIDFTISLNQETSEINIKVTNIWKALKGNLIIKYEIPTAIGRVEEIKENIVNIPLGETTFTYPVPKTELIYVTPKLDILYSGNQVSGLNGKCYKGTEIKNLNNCEYVLIAEITEETHTVSEAEFLKGKITSLELDIDELNRVLSEREQIRNKLENKITLLNIEISTLKNSINDQLNTINELGEKLELTRQDIEEMKSLLSLAEQTLKETNELIIAKQLEIQKLKEEILKQEQKILELLANLELKIQKLAEMGELTEEQLAELERIKTLFFEEQIKINELKALVEKDKEIINNLTQSNLNEISLSQSIKEENDLLKQKVSDLEEGTKLEKEIADSLKIHLTDSLNLVETLKKQNEQDTKTMENIKTINIDLQNLINELVSKNTELENLLEEKGIEEPTKEIPTYVFIIIGFFLFYIIFLK